MPEASLNLTVRDFDAYLPEKATSNAYARPRMEVKQRALAWARRVLARLADQGIRADLHASDEHLSLRNKKRVDCQWVWFWRDQAAREELDRLLARGRSISDEIEDPSPFKQHAFLALRIDASAVEVCFAVHPDATVDVDNLRARLAREGLAAELVAALYGLPEQFTIGVTAEERIACSSVTPGAIVEMLHRAVEGHVPLWIGWSVPREVALEHAAILDEQLEDAALALAPIYRLVAWSQENDHIALDRRLEGARLERERTHAEAQAETQRWQAERAAARERSIEEARARQDRLRHDALADPKRRPTLSTLFARGAAPAASRPSPDGNGRRRGAPADRSHAGSESGPDVGAARSASAAVGSPHTPGIIEKGSRVRVLAGAFAEKLGVVNELDGRGGARVLLGLLSTRLDLVDLEPVVEGRDRPALQSSHRRPGRGGEGSSAIADGRPADPGRTGETAGDPSKHRAGPAPRKAR